MNRVKQGPPQSNYRERIIADPNVLVGKPVVKGTRIPVEAGTPRCLPCAPDRPASSLEAAA
jgi:hypothetical protein